MRTRKIIPANAWQMFSRWLYQWIRSNPWTSGAAGPPNRSPNTTAAVRRSDYRRLGSGGGGRSAPPGWQHRPGRPLQTRQGAGGGRALCAAAFGYASPGEDRCLPSLDEPDGCRRLPGYGQRLPRPGPPYVIRTEKRKAIDADGKPLFKPRRTQMAPVAWESRHHLQQLLYEAVTDYVREGYNQALREKRSATSVF